MGYIFGKFKKREINVYLYTLTHFHYCNNLFKRLFLKLYRYLANLIRMCVCVVLTFYLFFSFSFLKMKVFFLIIPHKKKRNIFDFDFDFLVT
jgi:hypothetical protein